MCTKYNFVFHNCPHPAPACPGSISADGHWSEAGIMLGRNTWFCQIQVIIAKKKKERKEKKLFSVSKGGFNGEAETIGSKGYFTLDNFLIKLNFKNKKNAVILKIKKKKKNTRVGCHALLQGFFPTQGMNPGLPHCRRILDHLSYQAIL